MCQTMDGKSVVTRQEEDEACSSTLHPLNLMTVVLLVWVPDRDAILHKRVNHRNVNSLPKPFRLRRKYESIELV